MKNLFKNTDPNTPEVLFVFEDEQTGQLISNPLWNPEMTQPVNPERYGFKIWDTGGGCTAHGQEFLLDGQEVIILLTDEDILHIKDESVKVLVGLYGGDDHSEEMGFWEVTR